MNYCDCPVCGNRDWSEFFGDEVLEDDGSDELEHEGLEPALVACNYCGLQFFPDEVTA